MIKIYFLLELCKKNNSKSKIYKSMREFIILTIEFYRWGGLSEEVTNAYKPLGILRIVSRGLSIVFRRFQVYAFPYFIYFLVGLLTSVVQQSLKLSTNQSTTETISLSIVSMTMILGNLNLAGIGRILTITYSNPTSLRSVLTVISILAVIVSCILSWILGTLSSGMVIAMVADELTGQKASLKKSFSKVLEVFWSLLITSLMVTIIILLGSLLFIIPGIIFAVWYCLAETTVVLEGKEKTEALNRSKELTSGYRIDVFYVLLVLVIICFISTSILVILRWLLLGTSLATLIVFIESIVSAFLSLVGPSILTVVYFELLTRKTATETLPST